MLFLAHAEQFQRPALRQRVGRNTESELAVIFIGRVAHHLMEAGGVQIAKQTAEHVRMAQPGVAGEVKGRRGDRNGANVGDIGALKRLTSASFLIELFVTLVHEGAGSTYS